MELCLVNADLNVEYSVVSVSGVDKMALRIKELGFVSGTKVKVVNKSVLKHCAVVLVRDCFVALRENAIAKIMVRSL